jgi:hypothetical protein
LHVIERFQLIDGDKTIEVKVHVEDPGAYNMPWDAIQRYRRTEEGAMINKARHTPTFMSGKDSAASRDAPHT